MKCTCLKSDGQRCTREASTKVNDKHNYCWQHQNCKSSIPLQPLPTKRPPAVPLQPLPAPTKPLPTTRPPVVPKTRPPTVPLPRTPPQYPEEKKLDRWEYEQRQKNADKLYDDFIQNKHMVDFPYRKEWAEFLGGSGFTVQKLNLLLPNWEQLTDRDSMEHRKMVDIFEKYLDEAESYGTQYTPSDFFYFGTQL